jgi:hypothetical protein
MRADLHVHSRHSRGDMEPREIYHAAMLRGMDLVTLTDVDSIEGVLALADLPGTFTGEEVTCALPGGGDLRLGVFDLDERQHEAIAERRSDAEALFAYLAEERLPLVTHHFFPAFSGPREMEDLRHLLRHVSLHNVSRPGVAGSDAFALLEVGTAWTIVPGAATCEDYVEGLREGRTIPAGPAAGYRFLAQVLLDLTALSSTAAGDHACPSLTRI